MDFSIITPAWRGAIDTLPRLLGSIPQQENIEIVIVDNSKEPLSREEIKSECDFKLLHSSFDRHAGGSRNDGMAVAQGKWLLFADADDYYTKDAFDVFAQYKDSDADIIYFCADGVYPETGERSTQADLYTNLVRNYLKDPATGWNLRLSFHVPWAKMVRRSFIEEHKIRFDEVVANNDDYFSLLSGYYAKKIEAVEKVVYLYVVSQGSLMRRRSKEVMRTRLEVILRCNKFKKEHGLKKYQGSVAYFLFEGLKFGTKTFFEFLFLVIKYRQNPFIGCSNWFKSFKKMKSVDKKNKEYITNE